MVLAELVLCESRAQFFHKAPLYLWAFSIRRGMDIAASSNARSELEAMAVSLLQAFRREHARRRITDLSESRREGHLSSETLVVATRHCLQF